MRKIDKLDIVFIKRKSKTHIKKNTEIREGQAVFNAASEMFPLAVKSITGTEYDCYYEDDRIPIFLEKLQELDAE